MGIFADWCDKYHDCNLSVLPIWQESKACYIKEWSKIFCDQLPKKEIIDQIVLEHGDKEIGLALGPASNIIALDYDYTGPFSKELEEILLGAIPPSPVSKKGSKNWTKFYKYNDKIPTKHLSRPTGDNFLDILSRGSQTVLPPSKHSGNINYIWLTEDTLLDQVDLPELSLGAIEAIEVIAKLPNEYFHNNLFADGGRHKHIFGVVLRESNNFSQMADLISFILNYDLTVHKLVEKGPYFQDKKYLKGKTPEEFCAYIVSRMLDWKKKYFKDRGLTWSLGKNNEYPTLVDGFHFKQEKTDKFGNISTTYNPDYHGWSKYMINERAFVQSEGPSYIYDDNKNHFYSIGEHELTKYLISDTGKICKPQNYSLYHKVLRGESFKNHTDLNVPNGLINLKNGVLDLKSGAILTHSKEHFFTYCLPTEFNESAQCPRWIEFLNNIFPSDPEFIHISAEIFGYTLYGGEPWLHKAFVLFGEGRNGKSTYLNVLQNLLGRNNYSSIRLTDLINKPSVVHIDGKLANIVEETPNDRINSEIFKDAVSGGTIQARRLYENEYSFECKARFIFACNELPKFGENTVASNERLFFIPFKKYFTESERNHNIRKELLNELPGILNWAICGLKMLLENGKMTTSNASSVVMDEYNQENDSVYAWCKDHISINLDNKTEYPGKTFYSEYKTDTINSGRHPVSDMTFYRRFKKYLRALDGFIEIDMFSSYKKTYKCVESNYLSARELLFDPSKLKNKPKFNA